MQRTNIGLVFLRVLLITLILLNMAMIFRFSSQNAEQSSEVSGKVTTFIAEIFVPDFHQKSMEEQQAITARLHHPIRKLAHMSEFGALGAWIFLLLLTWQGRRCLKFCISLTAVLIYACTDEFHQSFSSGRANTFSDVLIDLFGAVITCSILLAISYFCGKELKKLNTTRYFLKEKTGSLHLKIAVAADLHGNAIQEPLQRLREEHPDLILIPGDLADDAELRQADASVYAFLRACAAIAPTYYSIGNHEIGCYHKGNPWRHPKPIPLTDEIRTRIAATSAVLLENTSAVCGQLRIFGLTSGINGKNNAPDSTALDQLKKGEGAFQILLCHHPEYYVPYLRKTSIDLIVCGHAHGGHWRIFGKGIYAPGQGLFPKYTSGVLDGRCVISRGMGDHTHIPRFGNPRELVMIYYGYTPEQLSETDSQNV